MAANRIVVTGGNNGIGYETTTLVLNCGVLHGIGGTGLGIVCVERGARKAR